MRHNMIALMLAGATIAAPTAVFADPIPDGLDSYVKSGVLEGTWVCSPNITVAAGPNWATVEKKEKLAILSKFRQACVVQLQSGDSSARVTQMTVQSTKPFKNLGRWTMESGDYKDL